MNSDREHIEQLINQGRYLEARSHSEVALKQAADLRVQQLYALAISKSGAPEDARKFLEPVYNNNSSDTETAGILAGIYKELFRKHQDSKFAVQSRDTYLKNFENTRSTYTGINAASMSAILVQASKSKALAGEVIALIAADTNDFWQLATLGEAHLLLKDKEKAIQYYASARKIAGSDWGKVSSAYNQLWLLKHFIPVSAEILRLFDPPAVVSFIGHMVDKPGAAEPRFPPQIEKNIKDAISQTLKRMNAKVGYSSLACGSDILFAEAMTEQNGELEIFLPFDAEDFVNTSIRFAGEQWVDRFHALTKRFPVHMLTRERYENNNELFALQSRIVFGSSVIRSAAYHTTPHLLTVLSETDLKRAEGGTRDTMRYWPFPKNHSNINPDGFVEAGMKSNAERISQNSTLTTDRRIGYLLLADLGALNEIEKGKLQTLVKAQIQDQPDTYLGIQETGSTALVISKTETGMVDTLGLMSNNRTLLQKIKITLHVGPVHGPHNTEGTALTTLQALAQYATPGSINASSQVAAVLALDAGKFSVEYSGIVSHEGENRRVYKIESK